MTNVKRYAPIGRVSGPGLNRTRPEVMAPRVRQRITQLVAETKQRVNAAIVERVTAPAVQAATEIPIANKRFAKF